MLIFCMVLIRGRPLDRQLQVSTSLQEMGRSVDGRLGSISDRSGTYSSPIKCSILLWQQCTKDKQSLVSES